MSLRPGITDEYLEKADVRVVTAAEADRLCGMNQSGLWIPYADASGNAVKEGGKPYGRLRLDQPLVGQKYHQRAGGNTD